MIKIVAVIAAFAAVQAHPGAAPLAYGAYGAYGYHAPLAHAAVPLLGAHSHYHFGHTHEAQPFLSCYEAFDNGTLINSIAVNIKPRTYGWGLAGYGAGHAGLEATINVYAAHADEAIMISFTEKSNALGSGVCTGSDYGDYLGIGSFKADQSASHDHGIYGYAYNYGHSFEPVAPHLAKTTLASEMMASFHIDHLEGFTSMAQLAGRGVIVCRADEVAKDEGGHWQCNNAASAELLPCCSLHYSGAGNSLAADGSRVSS